MAITTGGRIGTAVQPVTDYRSRRATECTPVTAAPSYPRPMASSRRILPCHSRQHAPILSGRGSRVKYFAATDGASVPGDGELRARGDPGPGENIVEHAGAEPGRSGVERAGVEATEQDPLRQPFPPGVGRRLGRSRPRARTSALVPAPPRRVAGRSSASTPRQIRPGPDHRTSFSRPSSSLSQGAQLSRSEEFGLFPGGAQQTAAF